MVGVIVVLISMFLLCSLLVGSVGYPASMLFRRYSFCIARTPSPTLDLYLISRPWAPASSAVPSYHTKSLCYHTRTRTRTRTTHTALHQPPRDDPAPIPRTRITRPIPRRRAGTFNTTARRDEQAVGRCKVGEGRGEEGEGGGETQDGGGG